MASASAGRGDASVVNNDEHADVAQRNWWRNNIHYPKQFDCSVAQRPPAELPAVTACRPPAARRLQRRTPRRREPSGRLDRGDYSPRSPLQIRTCRITASGSSEHGFAAQRTRERSSVEAADNAAATPRIAPTSCYCVVTDDSATGTTPDPRRLRVNDHPIFPRGDHLKIPPPG